MKKNRKLFAVILAAIFFATILFSYFFIVEQIHHDCTGEDCPICMEIQAALQTISSIKILSTLPLILSVFYVITQLCMIISESNCVKDTLITLKVEFLN